MVLKESDTNMRLSRRTNSGNVSRLLTRKRAALEDLSNVPKSSNATGKQAIVTEKAPAPRIYVAPSKKSSTSNRPLRDLKVGQDLPHENKEIITLRAKSKTTGSVKVEKAHELDRPASSKVNATQPAAPVTKSLKRSADEISNVAEKENIEATRVKKKARTQPWDDLDADDEDDPLMVAEYSDDIFDYLYELEKKYMPNPDYILDQNELEWSQRGLLMDWLVDIHSKLRLLPETLFLAGNIVDRFMTLRIVSLDKIQLVGITSLLLAAKYEEVFPPVLNHFVYFTGGNFEESDILGAEKFILQVLDFELSYPNPLNFLRRISKADDYDVQSRSFGKYFLEVSVVEHELLRYTPSMMAAVSMYIARLILGREEWDANLVHYSGDYHLSDIVPVARILVNYLASPVEHEALFKKYASKKYFKASLIARQWAKANWHSFHADESSSDLSL